MPICKFCTKPFGWGQSGDRWVPLVPVEDHEGLDRAYQDENGILRAGHALICVRVGGPTVRVAKLARTVKGDEVIGGDSPKKPVEVIDPDSGEIQTNYV